MPCEGIAYTLVESQDLMDGFEKDKNDLVITFDHFRTKGEQMKQKLRECSSMQRGTILCWTIQGL